MKCSKCRGDGEVSYDEDDRLVIDVCYHCGGSGRVDEETHFHDRLQSVASTLAYRQESDYRRWINSDPDGDGYAMGGYENGLSEHDYFRCRVWDRTDQVAQQLIEMPRTDQEFLIAWNEYQP